MGAVVFAIIALTIGLMVAPRLLARFAVYLTGVCAVLWCLLWVAVQIHNSGL